MSVDPVAIVRRFTEAYGAEDWDATFELLDERHELVVDENSPHGGVYRGKAATQDYFRSWLGAWTDREWHVEEVRPVGDDVLVVGRENLRGKGSGVVTERRSAVVHTVRDGKIARSRLYNEVPDALEQRAAQP